MLRVGGMTLSLKENSQISHSNKLSLLKVLYIKPGETPLYWELYLYPCNMLLRVGGMKFSTKEALK